MPSIESLRMIAASDLVWPVTYRFVCQGNRGSTAWEMSVDVPALQGKHDETVALGPAIWSASIATAITTSIDLVYFDYFIHNETPAPSIGGGGFHSGRRFGTPAPRDKTGVVGFCTEHGDRYGRRQQHLFGMPYEWQDENGLTDKGWDGLLGYAQLLKMGMSGHFGAGMMQHLLAYWNVVPATVGNFFGVGFRRVVSYNVFQYTDKAPDLSPDLWPPTGS